MRRCLTIAAGALLLCLLLAAPAVAGVANAGIPGAPSNNPIAGLPWGIGKGEFDDVWPSYEKTHGSLRRDLAPIALRPRVNWFGAWDDSPEAIARQYIGSVTGGRADVLTQLAVFRVDPWEEPVCHHLPTPAQQASYKQWIDAFAAGIGDSRVALILQPDLPFALCVPGHSPIPLQLVAYAARVFSALPHTTIYLDAGSEDWESARQAVRMLLGAGVKYTRGFALDDTHYDSNAREIMYGQKVVRGLARAHVPGLHIVINTAENGRPFTYQQYHGNFNNPAVCATRQSRRCATLGVPPTTDVTALRWQLPPAARRVAARLVDGYLWIGRPWLDNGTWPFDVGRALALIRTSPF